MAWTSSSTAPITRYPRRASIPSLVPGDHRTGVSSASCGIRQLSFCARLIGGGGAAPGPPMSRAQKLSWRMPQLALLTPVRWSPGTKLGMLALRGYLVLGAVLLLVQAIQLGGGSGPV